MNITGLLIYALKADSTLNALVGGRVYSVSTPFDQNPAAWISVVRDSNRQESAHDGNQHYSVSRYSLHIGGTDQALVGQVRDHIVENFNGVATSNGLTIYQEDDYEGYDEGLDVWTAVVGLSIHTNN